MHASPIADNCAIEFPIGFQNFIQQQIVVATVLTSELVVGTHYRPGFSFLNCGFKCWEINFVQSAVAHFHINRHTFFFLIVERKMFYTCCYTIFLNCLNIRNSHARRQIRVFAHVFKISSVERCTINVYTGAKQHSFATVASFFSYRFTV